MRLRFQARALRQIDEALGYIATHSPQGAATVEARLTDVLQLLKRQPRIGARTSRPNVRRVFLTPHPYLIDYVVRADEIVIQRFRHTARRPLP